MVAHQVLPKQRSFPSPCRRRHYRRQTTSLPPHRSLSVARIRRDAKPFACVVDSQRHKLARKSHAADQRWELLRDPQTTGQPDGDLAVRLSRSHNQGRGGLPIQGSLHASESCCCWTRSQSRRLAVEFGKPTLSIGPDSSGAEARNAGISNVGAKAPTP